MQLSVRGEGQRPWFARRVGRISHTIGCRIFWRLRRVSWLYAYRLISFRSRTSLISCNAFHRDFVPKIRRKHAPLRTDSIDDIGQRVFGSLGADEESVVVCGGHAGQVLYCNISIQAVSVMVRPLRVEFAVAIYLLTRHVVAHRIDYGFLLDRVV